MTGFLCFNCKPRAPGWGHNKWEILANLVLISLFALSIVEIVALATYANVFSNGTADGCCGIIEEKSFPFIGAMCFEEDIRNSHIHKQIFNGSVLCVINNTICEEYNYVEQGNSSTLEDCLNTGQYPLRNLCGVDIINKEATNDTSEVTAWCIAVLLIIFGITLVTFSEFIGCFDDSCWCQNRCVSLINKTLEIFIWCLLLTVSTVIIENTADNGYRNQHLPNSAANEYMHNNCELDHEEILWIDFVLDVPAWLQSDGYKALASVGVALSIIEFLLFFWIFLCGHRSVDKMQDVEQMEKTIEMGDNDKTTTTTTSGGIDTATNERGGNNNNDNVVNLETGDDVHNETGDVSDHESDEDVLYDNDDEKELEYVTPGGPDSITPQ